MVEVQFLGAGDAFGSGGRFQTCLSLRTATTHLLLDCGASSLVAMKRAGADPSTLDAILITHLHGDHFGGVPFFVLDAQFSRRERPLRVAGPPGLGERLRATMEVLFPGSASVSRKFALEVIELAERTPAALGEATVTAYPVLHASGAPPYALRVALDGKVVAYSGDTEWTDTLLEAADGADLFVCEAYSFDKPIKHHLSYATLRAQRPRLRCKRLLLTHLGPEMLARQSEVPEECAADGLVVRL